MMNKIITLGTAAVVAAGLTLGVAAPASAAPPWWYHRHHHAYGWAPGPAIGAGILGFAAGAALANSARANSYAIGDGHVAACEDAYRSYDPRTDTYLGYDGMRHYCEL
jgi:hypothetical protein